MLLAYHSAVSLAPHVGHAEVFLGCLLQPTFLTRTPELGAGKAGAEQPQPGGCVAAPCRLGVSQPGLPVGHFTLLVWVLFVCGLIWWFFFVLVLFLFFFFLLFCLPEETMPVPAP